MRFFIDSANLDEIKKINSTGLLDGVTTNPSLISKVNGDHKKVLHDICEEVKGPVSAEVNSHYYDDMVREGIELAGIANNIVIKLPLTVDGLRACTALVNDGYSVNVTLCFSATQALLAAKAGATFISPFIGRLDDISIDGMKLIEDIFIIFNNYNDINTKILVASVRSSLHVLDAAKVGADIITISPKLFWPLINHPLTDKGIEIFDLAWSKRNIST